MARQRSWSGCAKRRPQRRLRPRRRGRRPRRRRPKERRRPKMTTPPMTSGFKGGPRSGVFVLQRGPAGAGGAAPWMRACAADRLIKADTILWRFRTLQGFPRGRPRAGASRHGADCRCGEGARPRPTLSQGHRLLRSAHAIARNSTNAEIGPLLFGRSRRRKRTGASGLGIVLASGSARGARSMGKRLWTEERVVR
jgi:hypothetical protein